MYLSYIVNSRPSLTGGTIPHGEFRHTWITQWSSRYYIFGKLKLHFDSQTVTDIVIPYYLNFSYFNSVCGSNDEYTFQPSFV